MAGGIDGQMNLREKLEQLTEARDLDGILEVVRDAKESAVDEHNAEVLRVCGPSPETLHDRIQHAINATSSENGSNTPDHILADYLVACLAVFDSTVKARERWYGITSRPGSRTHA